MVDRRGCGQHGAPFAHVPAHGSAAFRRGRFAMESSAIPDDVRRFVLTSVPSVPFLEALLVLRASAPDALGIAEVAKRLYLGEHESQAILEQLAAARLAKRSVDGGGYRFDPAEPDLAEIVDRVAVSYAQRLIEMTNLIHSKTGRKAQQFADAFKLRKDE